MTSAEGEQYQGVWQIVTVDEPSRIKFDDPFANAEGKPNHELPVSRMEVAFEDRCGGGSRMVIIARYASAEDLDKAVNMGMEEGMQQSLGQMDALLA